MGNGDGKGGNALNPDSDRDSDESQTDSNLIKLLNQTAVMLTAVSMYCDATNSNATLMLGTKMAAGMLRMIVIVLRRPIIRR
ncbi:hypothetical protein CVN56_30585 [Rhodococcus sp. AQ5-07]|nr:hypothetical protein CVN56_30585 [Rhodococcus sp. AQ5-07]